MGNYCCKERRSKKKVTLLLVGLDNAGKTRAANGLVGERVSTPVPTVGFSVLNLKYADYAVKIFDLGGGANIRGIWHQYFVDAHGLIFVIDSSDVSRFSEVKMVLDDILYSDKISGKPILLLANKQDNENAVDEIEIIEYLNLEQLVNARKCPTLVQSCSASEDNATKLDLGVQKGYNWLMGYIHKHYDTLNDRVEKDVHEQEIIEKQELLEKIQRIKALHALEESKRNEDTIETYSDYAKRMNGDAKARVEEEEEESAVQKSLTVTFDEMNSDSKSACSSDSSISFPPVYVTNTYTPTERPKSAVEFVKNQLQMGDNQPRPSARSRSNKTAPIHLYGIRAPYSARERPSRPPLDRRNLKSADNVLFTISARVSDEVGVVDSSGDHNTIHFNNFGGGKLPPLKNSVPWVHKPNREGDGLSIVDIL